MSGRYQHQFETANKSLFPKWQGMLDAGTPQTDLHQVRCALGDDNLAVRCDVVAVRVRNERETFCVPWIEPKIQLRQVNAALVANFNHAKNYCQIRASSMAAVTSMRPMPCALTPA